jgi:hypothetical protein
MLMIFAIPRPIYHSYSAWSRLGHVHRVTTHHSIKPFIYPSVLPLQRRPKSRLSRIYRATGTQIQSWVKPSPMYMGQNIHRLQGDGYQDNGTLGSTNVSFSDHYFNSRTQSKNRVSSAVNGTRGRCRAMWGRSSGCFIGNISVYIQVLFPSDGVIPVFI